MNLNKVLILGRLTADPQLRTTQTGQQVANFSIATNRVWTDKNGARQEEVEYHNVVLWGRQAEIASQFLTKGSLALIEGRLRTRTWQGKDGQNRKTTEIIGERLQLGPRSAQPDAQKPPSAENASIQKEELPAIDIDEEEIKPEDIPF
ncbi:MAG: single-stranded DNA-binding protein [Candidatus Paceibacterota bacterium]